MTTEMMNSPEAALIEPLLEDVRELAALCRPFLFWSPAYEMNERLKTAQNFAHRDDAPAFAAAVLLGPTGAGKSTLFNALIRRDDASPVSSSVRCFTDRPYVAAAPGLKPLIHIPDELNPQFVDADLGEVILCDLPDIDGVVREHWETARRLIEQSDIVVYVTSPDKRADFRVHEEVRRWAVRKRWLFVLNRADQLAEEERQKIVEDWDRRLHAAGFHPDAASRFLVSAAQPHRFEFAEFRRALLEHDYRRDRQRLRGDGICGHLQHAAAEEILEPLRAKAAELARAEDRLSEKVRAAYRKAWTRRRAEDAFRQAVAQQAWRLTAERTSAFASLTAWLRTRWYHLTAAYRLFRLGFYRFSLWGAAAASLDAVRALLTGVLPLKRILEALGPDLEADLAQVANDVRRTLEDHELPAATERTEKTTPTPPTDDPSADGAADRLLNWLTQRLGLEAGDSELLDELRASVEETAEEVASHAVRPWVNLVANVLPFVILADASIRIGRAWVASAWYAGGSAEYPPLAFYGLAAGLLAVSVLPGYWLIASRIAAQGRRLNPAAAFHVDSPAVLEPLAARRRELEELIRKAEHLRRKAARVRKMISAGLPGAAAEQDRAADASHDAALPAIAESR
ncbi:MAG: hypothetical protein Kow0040_20480 [Thermogutta sp.]